MRTTSMWRTPVQAFLIQHEANAVEFMGNRTECALLMLLRAWGVRYEAIRSKHKAHIFQVYNFSSERKMASVLLRHGDGLRLYNKVCTIIPRVAASPHVMPVMCLMLSVGYRDCGSSAAGMPLGAAIHHQVKCCCELQCPIHACCTKARSQVQMPLCSLVGCCTQLCREQLSHCPRQKRNNPKVRSCPSMLKALTSATRPQGGFMSSTETLCAGSCRDRAEALRERDG